MVTRWLLPRSSRAASDGVNPTRVVLLRLRRDGVERLGGPPRRVHDHHPVGLDGESCHRRDARLDLAASVVSDVDPSEAPVVRVVEIEGCRRRCSSGPPPPPPIRVPVTGCPGRSPPRTARRSSVPRCRGIRQSRRRALENCRDSLSLWFTIVRAFSWISRRVTAGSSPAPRPPAT